MFFVRNPPQSATNKKKEERGEELLVTWSCEGDDGFLGEGKRAKFGFFFCCLCDRGRASWRGGDGFLGKGKGKRGEKGGRREAERERRGEREKGGGEKRRKGARKEERGRREKEREKEEQVSQYSDLNKITKPKNRASGGYSHPSPPLPVLQPPLS